MNKKLTVLCAAALLAGISGAASANDRVSFSISFGAPAYLAPPPVYYQPPVSYYQPPVTYYPQQSYPPAIVGYRGYDRRYEREFWRHEHRRFDRGWRDERGWEHRGR